MGFSGPCLCLRSLADPRLQPLLQLRDSHQVSGFARHGRRTRPLCAGSARCSTRPAGTGRWSACPRLLRFLVPLATSPLKSGLPGITTPGIFRPWPFSDLRRFAPSNGSPALFHTGTTYGIQRTRSICRLPCGPDRSILGTVPSGITRPGHAGAPEGHPHGAVVLLATMSTLYRSLRSVHGANVSLTDTVASNRYGRRARRHARRPGPDRLPLSRTQSQRVTPRHSCKQPIQEEARRYARLCRQTTSA